ncbi:S1C family serine protease [Ruminococcus flavefaciens]|uniref:Serine protease Do n=1 Tax=Ruminococcus flavefaciens TaxID=1265 RepID=A0A1M7KVS3_RUMFL|nr:trypsin-like peptidase domain-containing protein [Ruminococcus flavefaciens]SHM69344.1 serine protease Do [Ruminococcus flavefaciens]
MDERDNFYRDPSENDRQQYTPQHEKPADESGANGIRNTEQHGVFTSSTPPPQYQNRFNQPNGYSQPQNNYNNGYQGGYGQQQNGYYGQQQYGQPQRPVYDKFMYEPIGFEELEHGQNNGSPDGTETFQKRPKGQSAVLIMFVILIIIAALLAVFGIVYDIINSEKVVDKIGSPKPIVLYKESKPKGALDEEKYKDENGRYTPEGAAALVKPSIVKIYTYKDYGNFTSKHPMGTGSGIVLNEDGYIATNAHVLEADGYHVVETVDGDTYAAKVIGRDSKTDIAVVKVEADGLKPATLGNSDEAVVGEQVIAIGNPANLASTVTDGIVSAVNRKISSDTGGFEMDCIQTNADISPGNSGGALVNMYGQVIGITSSKYVSAEFEGLGFAITINEASPVIEELIKNGYVGGRFKIGIQLYDMSSEGNIKKIQEELGFDLPKDFKGVYILKIEKDYDIANTALKPGDFITAINGTNVTTYHELYDAIKSQYKVGDKVPATCAHLDKDGEITYYDIEFKLVEDTSGNY